MSNHKSRFEICCLDRVPFVFCGVPSGRPAAVALSQYLTRLNERHEIEALFPDFAPDPYAELSIDIFWIQTKALNKLNLNGYDKFEFIK
jgi:hypothetical protein